MPLKNNCECENQHLPTWLNVRNYYYINLFKIALTSQKGILSFFGIKSTVKSSGFESFKSYMEAVIPARQKLFQELLKKGKTPKTIFCFGKGNDEFDYGGGFIKALIQGLGFKKFPCKLDTKTLQKKGYNLIVNVYEVDNPDKIKRIIVCPFPFAHFLPYVNYEFTDNDWQTICDLAKE